jgi:hypothetical protein
MRDLNIYCSTTANHRSVLEQLKQMAIQNNTTGASIYDLGRIVQSDSIAELNHVLKASEDKQSSQKQQELQQQQQMQQQQLESMQQTEKMKLDAQAMEKEKDRQRDILVAEIKSAGYGSMADVNKNQLSDYTDAMKEIRQSEAYEQQTNLQMEKQSNENLRQSQKMDIEREKILAQKEIADKQLQIARENKNKYDNKNKNKEKE